MANENARYSQEDILDQSAFLNEGTHLDENSIAGDAFAEEFDFDKMEEELQNQLDKEFADLELLKEERDKIGNPDSLGKVILDEVWSQFGNQIGLDMTNETLNQKYDREHAGETYADIGNEIMKDERYKKANKEMKEKQKSGDLKDEYTGKTLGANDDTNLDHTVSRKELYENKRRQQANIDTKDLANKKENLNATNASLNKSKNSKSVDEYLSGREEREEALRKQNESANKKVDEKNISDVEKRLEKEKNNKRFQDKLDADDELMRKADKEARTAINNDIAKGVAKETAKKAGKDALKQIAVSALFLLLKEIMNGFVRFLKDKAKSFKGFLGEMKEALKSFFVKLKNVVQTGVSSVVGTIVTEIFGPIVSTFKRLASLIKQGISSVIEAVKYLKDKENKNKPFSVKVAQVGKIITAGLVAGGAIFLGEVFEKLLNNIPIMKVQIPLLGSLANIVGMFLASIVSGIVGAIVINLIDKLIAKKQKAEAQAAVIDRNNKIIDTQRKLQAVREVQLERGKLKAATEITERHTQAAEIMKDSYGYIMEDFVEDFPGEANVSFIDNDDEKIDREATEVGNELFFLLSELKQGGK